MAFARQKLKEAVIHRGDRACYDQQNKQALMKRKETV